MATPSGLFTFEDVTLNGFKYKRTTADYGTIFPLYSELDTSIAYTMPITLSYRRMTPTLINKQVPQRGLATDTFFQDHYYSNAGHTTQAWSTLGEVIGNPLDDKSCVLYWTFADTTLPYYFNGSHGNATIGTSTSKFISGFDISHLIFQAVIKGYTKAQYDAYKNTGSNQTEVDITLQDLIDNPNDYFVSRFSIQPVAYWDDTNYQWRNNPPVYLTCLLDAGEVVQGVASHDAVLFGNQTTASVNYIGINRTGSYHLQCTTQSYKINDSTYYRRLGGIPAELDSNNPYSLGSVTDWHMKPYWDADALRRFLDAQSSNSDNNTNSPELILSTGHGEIYGYDSFNVRQNFSGSPQGQFHYSLWDKKLSAVAYGLEVSSFMASAGCYFQIGNADNNYYNTLNNNNITPDTLHLRPEIALGTMLEDGTTNGQWVVGEDIEDYDGINKNGDVVHPDFDPNPPGPEPPDEDDYTNMGLGVPGNGLGGLTKYAILTRSEMLALVTDFNTNSQTGNQFSNHIICCYKLGVSSSLICSKSSGKIVLNRELIINETTSDFESANNYNLVSSQEVFIDCGGFDVPRMTDTFYDFSPYSSYELFIPCCGWINLPDVVAGRHINVYLLPDLPTCSCRGIVRITDGSLLSHGTTIASVNGILGSSIPFSIFENGLMKSATLSGAVQVMGGTGMVGTALATGNVGLGVSGVSTMLQGVASTYVAGNTNYTATKGGATDYSVFGDGYTAVLKINSPVVKKPANFGHTVGYMCNKTGTLGSFSGFTIVSNPHINISATSTEKEEIKRLLEEGVIL